MPHDSLAESEPSTHRNGDSRPEPSRASSVLSTLFRQPLANPLSTGIRNGNALRHKQRNSDSGSAQTTRYPLDTAAISELKRKCNEGIKQSDPRRWSGPGFETSRGWVAFGRAHSSLPVCIGWPCALLHRRRTHAQLPITQGRIHCLRPPTLGHDQENHRSKRPYVRGNSAAPRGMASSRSPAALSIYIRQERR